MGDASKIQSAVLSRRSILRNLAYSAGGAAVLGTIVSGARVAEAQTKATQKAVGYQDTPKGLGTTVSGTRVAEAQTKATQKAVGYQDTPKGAQRCDNCRQFEPPSSCKTVEGTVAPAGWCKVYVKKPA